MGSTPPRDFLKAWRWCPKRLLCVNQNAGDRQGLPPARDTLRRTPTAISLAGCVPAIGAYFRFSRPTDATKSQLLIQIIRTPPPCLKKIHLPRLTHDKPGWTKNQRTQSTQSRAIALGYFMCILVAARMLDLQDIARCPASFRRITSLRIPLAKNCRTATELDLEPVRRAEIEQPTRSRI